MTSSIVLIAHIIISIGIAWEYSDEFALVGQFGCTGKNEAGSEWDITLEECKQKCIDYTGTGGKCRSIEFFSNRGGRTLCQASTSCSTKDAIEEPWSLENQNTYGPMYFYHRLKYYDGGETLDDVYTQYEGKYCTDRNNEIITDITLAECMHECKWDGTFLPVQCISFEYSEWNKRCSLSASCTTTVMKDETSVTGDIDIYMRQNKALRDQNYYSGQHWEIYIQQANIGEQKGTWDLFSEVPDPFVKIKFFNDNSDKIFECATGRIANQQNTVTFNDYCRGSNGQHPNYEVMYETNSMIFEIWDHDLVDVEDLWGDGNDYITTFYKSGSACVQIGFAPVFTGLSCPCGYCQTVSVQLNGGSQQFTLYDKNGYWLKFDIAHKK